MADDKELLLLRAGVEISRDDAVEMNRMTVEFVGTFIEANLKAVDWLTSHPEVRLVKEVGPFRARCTGPSSYGEPDWTVIIEYEERTGAGSRAA